MFSPLARLGRRLGDRVAQTLGRGVPQVRKAETDALAASCLERVNLFSGSPPPGWIVDRLGIRTQWKFVDGHWPHTAEQVSQMWQQVPAPEVNGLEYYEWVDLVHAVVGARERFVMVELGAGYGRWAVRAARLLEALNPMPCTLVAVEAEPTHFEWLLEHFRDNGLDPTRHHLVCAPVARSREAVNFLVGQAASCYGQEIVAAHDPRDDGLEARSMPAVTLADILEPHPRVDLIDLDIQGAELEVLSATIDLLDARVKRLQIGTHGRNIERGLRQLFQDHGWQIEHDFSWGSKLFVPKVGRELEVEDGVQTWINPRLGAKHFDEGRVDALRQSWQARPAAASPKRKDA
jgi:FkbM family methyltransferase